MGGTGPNEALRDLRLLVGGPFASFTGLGDEGFSNCARTMFVRSGPFAFRSR